VYQSFLVLVTTVAGRLSEKKIIEPCTHPYQH
jgi:hypothetical protein